MSCANWKSSLVGRLYGEIDPAEDAALDSHLAACETCRDDLDRLSRTRDALRSSEPEVPPAPRLLVLEPRPAVRPWMAFAAGAACAALVGSGALAAGYRLGARQADLRVGPPSSSLSAPSADPQIADRIAALEARLPGPNASGDGDGTPAAVTREEMEAQIARLERRLKGARASDLEYLQDYLLTQIVASEERAGLRTREALRYAVLASNPNLSER